MVKSLITGAGGFVASHLIEYLLKQGEEIIGTYRWQEDLSRIQKFKNKIKLIPMDLNDLSSCIRAMENKPDYIYHLAAQSYVSDSYILPIETINTNTLGTVKLLEAIRLTKDLEEKKGRNYDPRVHICSSSEVYGLVRKEDVPIKESCPFNPSNPYAVGKVGEDMAGLMYFTNFGIKTIRTRMFTHTGYGRTMLSAECNFARQIALIEKGKKPILKHGNLNSVRTFLDVRDAVRAYYLMMRQGKPGEVYNIGGETTYTIGEMLNFLISISTVKNIKTIQDPKLMRPYDVTLQIPDCSKFRRDVDWKPKYSFEETMKEVLRFWRENV